MKPSALPLPRRLSRATLPLAAALAALGAPSAPAVVFTWSASPSSNSWSLFSNWTGGQAPPTSGLTTSDIVYNASIATFPNLSPGYSVRSVTFNAGASAYTFGQGILTLGAAGITQNSTSTQSFQIPVSLGAASTWTVGNTGPLVFSSGLALGANNLTLSATGNGTINGAISGSGAVTKSGTGSVTLTGAGTFTGATAVTAGTLALSGMSTVSPISVGAGATLIVNAGSLIDGRGNPDFFFVFDGSAASPASVFINGGTLYSDGDFIGNVGRAVVTQSGGAYNLGGVFATAIAAGAGSSAVYHLNGGTYSSVATVFVGSAGEGTFNVNGGTAAFPLRLGAAAAATGTLNLNGGILQSASVLGGAGTSIFNFNGGILQARTGTTTFFQGLTTANVRVGGAVIDTAGFDVTIAQPLVHSTIAGDPAADGGLTKLGAGTLRLTGANTFTGPVTVQAGTLAVANDSFLGSGSVVNLRFGATLAFSDPGVTTQRTFSLAAGTLGPAAGGTLNLTNGAAVYGGALAGNCAFTGSVTLVGTSTAVNATLAQTNGELNLLNHTFGVGATFNQAAIALLNSNGPLLVAHPTATLTLNGVSLLQGGTLSGAVTVGGTGRVTQASSANTPLYLDGSRGFTIQPGGVLEAQSGTSIELGGLLTNHGTQSGVLNVGLGGVVRGAGAFGTVNLAADSTFSAAGSVGTLNVGAGALVSVDGNGKTLTVAGQLVNGGTMRFTNGAKLRVTSPANQVVNTGVIDVISGQLDLPAGFVNNGVVIDSSVVRVKEVSRANGSVAVKIDGYPGHSYRLQRSASLTNGTFTDVPGSAPQSNPAGATSVVTLTFTDASPAAGQGFYRVVVDA